MFVILWEFEVKRGCEPAFENAYGPHGDWAQFFGSDPHYRMTYLLKVTSRPETYCTMDFWDSEEAYENFLKTHSGAYQALDRSMEGLTFRERHIASFVESNAASIPP